MSLFNIFSNKKKPENSADELENFMFLIRVYYQASIAAQTGFNNLKALQDLRIFKQTYHIATQNNKIGLSEKKQCQKMLQGIYHIGDNFFNEIDSSIKKNCRTIQDLQPYMLKFQDLTQNLLFVISNLMNWKFQILRFFKNATRSLVEKQVHKALTRTDWKDEGVRLSCIALRKYQTSMCYSEAWLAEFSYNVLMLGVKANKANNAK